MTQLVELQRVLPDLERAGVAVFSISYDSVEVLRSFAERESITFPMLSDEGSEVITRLGLLNEHVHEQHAVFGFKSNPRNEGVPYPGVFALDESGTITARRFFDLYRERETGPGLVERALGLDIALNGPASFAAAGSATVNVRLDADEYKPHQRIWLYVDVTLDPGGHVFAAPAPEAFTPLDIEIDPIPGLFVDEVEWPSSQAMRVEGVREDLQGYKGDVRLAVPLRFFMPRGTGDLKVTGRVHLQVCTATTCDLPGSVEFALPMAEGRFVTPPPRDK